MTDILNNSIDETDLLLEELLDEIGGNDNLSEIQNLTVNDYIAIINNYMSNKWLIDAINYEDNINNIDYRKWEELASKWANILKVRGRAGVNLATGTDPLKEAKKEVLNVIQIYNNNHLYYNLYLKYNILPILISTTKGILDYWTMKNIQNKKVINIPIKTSKVWIPSEIDYFNDKETLQQTFESIFNEEIKTSIETYLSNGLMNFDPNASIPYVFSNEEFGTYFAKCFDTEARFNPNSYYFKILPENIEGINSNENLLNFFNKYSSTVKSNNLTNKNIGDHVLLYKIKKLETWRIDYQEEDSDLVVYFKKNKKTLIKSISEKIKDFETFKELSWIYKHLKEIEYLTNKAINGYIDNTDILPHKNLIPYLISPEAILAEQIIQGKIKFNKGQVVDQIDYSEIYNRLNKAYEGKIVYYDKDIDVIEISRGNIYKGNKIQRGYKAVIDLTNDMNAPTKVQYNINISYFSPGYDINKELLYNSLIRIPIDKLLSLKTDLLKDKSYKNLFLKPFSFSKFNKLGLSDLLGNKPYIREVYEPNLSELTPPPDKETIIRSLVNPSF